MRVRPICAAVLAVAVTLAVPGWSAFAQTAPSPTDSAADKKSKPSETRAEKKAKATAARKAAQERQRQCGREWKEARKAGTVDKSMTWPKYYSACNKRLKEKSA
ncbi:MAG: hypothetical protein KJZ73_17535 [Pseudorhodoplanes sp.]|nr:hypothetical protein [Pseudorhodoplanes sp.]MBW7949657.1 hypothetical protein [Pseudorhodoplanes sp.]MCL4713046.1 hypothetical protein [Pseudorhodoplanes sp.]MCQ3941986.1 hypothetical protein [Alphaproteobacteria bacterium]GIK82202.1 MAG: hypothetical protein BroJett024_33070 [Alphaproteobacteria bacterium]